MFGEKAGYISSKSDESSEKRNAEIDKQVQLILDVSLNLAEVDINCVLLCNRILQDVSLHY